MTEPFDFSMTAALPTFPTASSRALRRHRREVRRRRVLSYSSYRDWFEQSGDRAIGIATTTRCLCSCWMCTDGKPKHNQTKLKRGRVRKEILESVLAEHEGYLDYLDQYLIDFCGSIDYATRLWERRYGL